jgi:hypothetical protein
VIHQRERLPLGFEARDDAPRFHPELDDFQRHVPADGFRLLGEIDHAAAALADFFEQFVAADAVADFFLAGQQRRGGGAGAVGAARRMPRRAHHAQGGAPLGEKFVGRGRRIEQLLDPGAQRRFAGACLGEEGGAGRGIGPQPGGLEEFLLALGGGFHRMRIYC